MNIYLKKRTLLYFRVCFLFIFVLISFLLCFINIVFALIFAVIATCYCCFYLPKAVKNYKITVDKKCIHISRGVIFKRHSILPDKRLIYFKIYRTPIADIFGLCGVKFEVTGRGITVLGIQREDAKKLEDSLREFLNEN